MDCSRPGSSVHIILQVRILEQGATSFSREPPWPRDRTCVSCGSHIGRQVLYHREPPGDGVIPMRGLSICQGKGAKSNSRRLNYRSWDSFHVEAEAEDRGKDRFGLWFWQLVELLISNNCHFIWHRADAEFVFVNERGNQDGGCMGVSFMIIHQTTHLFGLPCGCGGKEPTCQCRRCGFNPWLRNIPRRRKWQPTPVFLPEKSHGQKSLVGYSPQGHKESNMTEWLSMHAHTFIYTFFSVWAIAHS